MLFRITQLSFFQASFRVSLTVGAAVPRQAVWYLALCHVQIVFSSSFYCGVALFVENLAMFGSSSQAATTPKLGAPQALVNPTSSGLFAGTQASTSTGLLGQSRPAART